MIVSKIKTLCKCTEIDRILDGIPSMNTWRNRYDLILMYCDVSNTMDFDEVSYSDNKITN